MKRIRTFLLCSLLFSFLTSTAAGIDFLHNKAWKEILAQAKKENKLIFLDAYASWCGPCKYMQSDIFTDNSVGTYYNRSFINVKMDMEEGEGIELSEQLGVQSYPTLFFINGDGQVIHKKIGAMDAGDFLQLGTDAMNPGKQFYTIQKKAITGNLTPKDFHQWIHEAEEMDEDADSVIISFLKTTKSQRMEKEMLSIMLDHAPLNKEQVDFLHKNKEACLKVLSKTNDEFNSAFLTRVTIFATTESLSDDEVLDFPKFQQIVQAYFPDKALLVTKKMKIKYYSYKEEKKKCLDELADLITSPTLKLNADDLAYFTVHYIKTITSEDRIDEFVKKISQYKLLPNEATTKAYQKDFALFALYFSKDDKPNMETYSQKVLKNPYTPDEILGKVKELLEEDK